MENQLNVPSNQPVIVYVWATWCLPCRTMSPAIERAAEKYHGQVELRKLNADEHLEEIKTLKIMGVPTVILYQHGQETYRRTGALSETELESLFAQAATNQGKAIRGPSQTDRTLRLGASLVLLALAFAVPQAWFFALLAGVIGFSAVYDRCPIYKAITSFLKDKLRPAVK